MNEFLTAGFNLHILKDFLDSVKTDNFWLDSFFTIGAIYLLNNKQSFYKLCNYQSIKDYLYNYFHKEIEYRLSSLRKTNYESSFNVCHN